MAADYERRMDAWRRTRCEACGGLGFTNTMDRCRACGGTGRGAGAGVGVGRNPAERNPRVGTDASPRRRIVVAIRPICARCRGRLYLEPGTLADGGRELVCLNCGARCYVGGDPCKEED